jgi:rubrerythrin
MLDVEVARMRADEQRHLSQLDAMGMELQNEQTKSMELQNHC